MTNRREFIKLAATTSAALAFGGMMPGIAASRRNRIIGANDTIRIAVIGVNARGKALAQNFAKMPLCEVTHLCDCDSNALAACQAEVQKITGKIPVGVKDIRDLLAVKEIDGVVIAMPDHWHASAAIMALNVGKHVYLEKPTSHNPAENEMLLLAAKKHSRQVITVGNQRRSWPQVREGILAVQDGIVGKVNFAKCWYTNNRPSIGIGKAMSVPANLDWELWQGPAPRVAEFKDNIVHYNWHWFWHWGTGEALNNGTHFVDMMRWGLQVGYPTLVSSIGGRWTYSDDWETPDSQLITFQFGDEAAGSWEGRSCNRAPVDNLGVGTEFYGEKGSLVIGGGNGYTVFDIDGKCIKEVKSDVLFREGDLQNPSEKLDAFHFQNWFDAIRQGTALNSTLEDACMSTQLVQLGNIAQRVGHSLRIDSFTGRILDAPDSQPYWGRDYEPGWKPKIR